MSTTADEPECEDGHGHVWRTPREVVGGGVQGHGGGVVVTEVCRHCGRYRETDTWAQSRETGERGLASTKYRDADDASMAWVWDLRHEELCDALRALYELPRRDSDGVVIIPRECYPDDSGDDAALDELRDALPADWEASYTGHGNDFRIDWVGSGPEGAGPVNRQEQP